MQLRYRPGSVLSDQGFGIARGLFEGGQGGFVSDISQRHADISEQAAAFCAQHGGAGETLFKPGFLQGQQFEEIRLGKVRTGLRLHQLPFAGESVPWTDGQAIVATVDPVANGRAQFDRDGAFELDGEVRDAAPGIELEGSPDGRGGARGDTP